MNVTSVQERLQLKREPLDKWSLREELCLASAVFRSGDQNWMSVSRALKPFGESNRPSDWFHQKNCAAQYGALLANVDTPKRKKRSGSETGIETPSECILKRLIADRQAELRSLLAEEKAEFKKLQEDMKLLQSGRVSEEQLDKWCKEIDEEESKREQEASNHAKWLREREFKKQQIEKAFRPTKPESCPMVAQKRATSDIEDFNVNEREMSPTTVAQQQLFLTPNRAQQQSAANKSMTQYSNQQLLNLSQQQQLSSPQLLQSLTMSQEPPKPALSPLLTSLLKSPSQVQNLTAVSTSILHSAITSPSNKLADISNTSSPTITSLLNSTSTNTAITTTGLTHFTINQESSLADDTQPLSADLLDDSIKIDDLAKSILVQDGPFPEIKKEEVDDIISEIIENNQDLVSDPEQHLQLDGNGDININLELDDLEQEEELLKQSEQVKIEENVAVKNEEKVAGPLAPVIDPFEFREDPILFETPVKPSVLKQDNPQYLPLYHQQSVSKPEEIKDPKIEQDEESHIIQDKPIDGTEKKEVKNLHGSVEIVEVLAEERGNEGNLNKSQICDIVHSNNEEENSKKEVEDEVDVKVKAEEKMTADNQLESSIVDNDESTNTHSDNFSEQKTSDNSSDGASVTLTSSTANIADFADDLYDNVNMEVKIDKTGKTKRDYSRLKKREEKSFDMLLAIEKAHLDNMSEEIEELKLEKKDQGVRIKHENDRSNSPWADEEPKSFKRRLSTPMDSSPNSPASSIAYEDDKDYKNWKKSVMLVYNELASNKYASLFLKPITEEQAPGYNTIVYKPMDLQTLKKHIDGGVIRTSLEFKRDVMLMFTNAIMYNKTNDTVYNMALQMQQEAMEPIEILLQAERQANVPVRRETRTSESSCKRKRISEDPVKSKKKKED